MRQSQSRSRLLVWGFVGGFTVACLIAFIGILFWLTLLSSNEPDAPTYSAAYLDPHSAMAIALEEAFGSPPARADPYAQLFFEHAQVFIRLYHLAHSEPGSYVDDTKDYQSWLNEFVRLKVRHDGGDSSAEWEFRRILEHVHAQIESSIYEPESEIGQRFRQMESGNDPSVDDPGPHVYWDYLIEPWIFGALGPFVLHPTVATSEAHKYNRLEEEYRVARLRGTTSDESFGDFLQRQGYLPLMMGEEFD